MPPPLQKDYGSGIKFLIQRIFFSDYSQQRLNWTVNIRQCQSFTQEVKIFALMTALMTIDGLQVPRTSLS
jgi:hypothetical protein